MSIEPVWNARGLILFLMASAMGSAASAQTQDADDQAVQNVLSIRHVDGKNNPWAALPPSASQAILRRLKASDSNSSERTRLLEGLGSFKDEASVEFLKQEARTSENGVARATALESLAASQGAGALDFLRSFADHPDKTTRKGVLVALSRIPGEESKRVAKEVEAKSPLLNQAAPGAAGAKLQPVSNSEEAALSQRYSGRFEGYALALQGANETLSPQKATLFLSLDPKTPSELRVGAGASVKTYGLRRIAGKGAKAAGAFIEAALEHPFAAELSRLSRSTLLRVEVPSLKLLLILKRAQ